MVIRIRVDHRQPARFHLLLARHRNLPLSDRSQRRQGRTARRKLNLQYEVTGETPMPSVSNAGRGPGQTMGRVTMSHQCSDDLTFPAYVLPSNQGHTRQTSPSVPSLSAHPRAGVSTMGKVTAESESISSTCRRRRLPIDGTSIQDPVAEVVVRSRRRARIGAIHPGAGSVGAEAPARPGSANSAIQLSAAAGHHGGRSVGQHTH